MSRMKYRIDRREALRLLGGTAAVSLVAVPGARVHAQSARQGQLSDQLARAGRARRLLSRGRQRHLQEIRHRLRPAHGRSAAEPLADAARRPRRHDHVERLRGPQLRQGKPAVPVHRGDLPEGPAGPHLASECRQRHVRRAQGQADPDRRCRAHQLLAVPAHQVRLHRRADPTLHVQHGAVPGGQEHLPAGISVVRALRHHAGRRDSRSSICSPTPASTTIRPRSTSRARWSTRRRTWCSASSTPRSKAGPNT